jgi:hypothetical protein
MRWIAEEGGEVVAIYDYMFIAFGLQAGAGAGGYRIRQ